MALPAQPLTPEEYLARERAADGRSEYYAGCTYAMSGASRQHSRIVINLAAGVHAQLRGRPCEAFVTDMRVKVDATGLYTYPDLVAVCGEPAFEDEELDTLLNPVAIVEVLSRSTDGYDRGEKFGHYDRVPTLREYLVLAQTRMHAEYRVRDGGSGSPWTLTLHEGADAQVLLRTIGCTLRLGDLYERVEFPAEPTLRRVYEDAPTYPPVAAAAGPA